MPFTSTRLYKKIRICILSVLYELPFSREYAYRRLPRHHSGYKEYWANPESRNYRSATLREDQEKSPMRHYPSPAGLRRALARHSPKNVLDVGCGYGKHLEILAPHFEVEGCDVSEELLALVREDLKPKTFHLDIVSPPAGWIEGHADHWDVVFCWGVLMYFIDDAESMRRAMQHLERMAVKKVLVWEWKHVCDYMRSVHPSSLFEYHHLPVTAST